MSDVTRVIEAIQHGDPKAAEELLPLVYEELSKLAPSKMANEAAGNTLQPTALVHEAGLRLVGNDNPKFAGRAHFFAAAAEAMRRILIENARRKRALRHGGGQKRVDFEPAELASASDHEQLLAVNEALDKLAAQSKPQAELVKVALLCRHDPRGSGRRSRHVRAHRRQLLGPCPGLALSRTQNPVNSRSPI